MESGESVDNCCLLPLFLSRASETLNLTQFFMDFLLLYALLSSFGWPWQYFSGVAIFDGSDPTIHRPNNIWNSMWKTIYKIIHWLTKCGTKNKSNQIYSIVCIWKSIIRFNRIKIAVERAIHFNRPIVELYFLNIHENRCQTDNK